MNRPQVPIGIPVISANTFYAHLNCTWTHTNISTDTPTNMKIAINRPAWEININILTTRVIWLGCFTPKHLGRMWFTFVAWRLRGWWDITYASAWNVATLYSVTWRIIQSLNSRFDIFCAIPLFHMVNKITHTRRGAHTHTHARTHARTYTRRYIHTLARTHTYIHTYKHTHRHKQKQSNTRRRAKAYTSK